MFPRRSSKKSSIGKKVNIKSPDSVHHKAVTVAEKVSRWMLRVSGFLLLAIGLVGIATPILPTTIFLILATICFSKSDPKLEHWMLNHPRFGATLTRWFDTGSISMRTKVIAIATIVVVFGITVYRLGAYNSDNAVLLQYRLPIIVALIICEVALVAYLVTRPTDRKIATTNIP